MLGCLFSAHRIKKMFLMWNLGAVGRCFKPADKHIKCKVYWLSVWDLLCFLQCFTVIWWECSNILCPSRNMEDKEQTWNKRGERSSQRHKEKGETVLKPGQNENLRMIRWQQNLYLFLLTRQNTQILFCISVAAANLACTTVNQIIFLSVRPIIWATLN